MSWCNSRTAKHEFFVQGFLDAFQQRLQELGWIAGRNAEIDVRWAPADSIRVYAAELVSLSPDVLVATDTPTTKALRDVRADERS